ncbi:MAG: preprotein translocase subunit YajC [Alphaproteobacteria bacterium]|nr:preprotein translocase subunit YajC [Alphaproteobacteria bacterium]
MIDLSSIFISAAFAQEAAPAGEASSPVMSMIVPYVLIFLVFYFLVIRPNQKRLAEQDKMVKSLQKGDRVVTSGGIHGKVAKVEDKQLMLEIAEGVQIKIDIESISSLEPKPEVSDKGSKEGEKKA